MIESVKVKRAVMVAWPFHTAVTEKMARSMEVWDSSELKITVERSAPLPCEVLWGSDEEISGLMLEAQCINECRSLKIT